MCAPVLRGRIKTRAKWPAMLASACACWALLALRAPAVVHAYEDQLTLGVGLGYANAVSDNLPAHGALLDVTGSLGLGSAWALRGRMSYAIHPDDPPLHVGLLGVEFVYLIDVVEVVPYFGLGPDAFLRVRNHDATVDAASHVVIGFDYLVSRKLTLGIDGRAYALWTALAHDPAYIAVSASVTWMFER
jgi:hypothetical protein